LLEVEKMSNVCLRDALSYLDKISKHNCQITVKLLEEDFGILDKKKLEILYKNILDGKLDEINLNIDDIAYSGLTPLNFINEFVEFLLNKIINGEVRDNDGVQFIKKIIFKLNNIILNFNSVVNPFTLIKVELITSNYFPGNNFVNISREIISDDKKEDVIEKSKVTSKVEMYNYSDEYVQKVLDVDKLKNIRINNSFVNASKDLKIDFTTNWNAMLSKLNIENDFNLLGYIETAEICVVSKTNVLFSFKGESDAIIFNKNVFLIELKFNEINNSNYKFIALSNDEWNVEKNKFINNKNKIYKYINEKNIEEEVDSKDLALDIFGNEIIEIR